MDNIQELIWKDALMGAIVGLVHACTVHEKTQNTDLILLKALSAYQSQDAEVWKEWLKNVQEEKRLVAPGCSTCPSHCGNTDDYAMGRMWNGPEELKSIKLVLIGLSLELAAAVQVIPLETDAAGKAMDYLHRILFTLSDEWDMDFYIPLIKEAGKILDACRRA